MHHRRRHALLAAAAAALASIGSGEYAPAALRHHATGYGAALPPWVDRDGLLLRAVR